MKKKIFIIFSVFAALILLIGLVYVFLPKTAANTAGREANPAFTKLVSFRGVLADVLNGIQGEVEKIEEAVSSPFPGDQKKPAETSPAPSTENNFTFAILGDTQYFKPNNPQGNFQKAMAQIAKLNPSLIAAEGDLVGSCDGDSKCANNYSNWKNIVGSFMPKTYAVQGNHDRTGDDKTDGVWRSSFNFPTNGPSGFSEQVYSLDFGNSHFVFLDSDKPKEHLVNGEQRAWLEKDLSANKKENIFVFFHEPAYPVSSKINESLDVEAAERNALWQILKKYNVTAVFNGHEHVVSRRKIDGIYQFVFGDTDSFNHELPKPGVAEYSNQGQGRFGLVKVSGKEITVETHGPDGALLNTFTFSK
ncbi:MAG: metallophosphoesterase [Candidatus Moranbacteria bacterium]|nr:metallophosphoesterase [Candidatus Moranbacteria bacterium]